MRYCRIRALTICRLSFAFSVFLLLVLTLGWLVHSFLLARADSVANRSFIVAGLLELRFEKAVARTVRRAYSTILPAACLCACGCLHAACVCSLACVGCMAVLLHGVYALRMCASVRWVVSSFARMASPPACTLCQRICVRELAQQCRIRTQSICRVSFASSLFLLLALLLFCVVLVPHQALLNYHLHRRPYLLDFLLLLQLCLPAPFPPLQLLPPYASKWVHVF
jgi:hypothetical protein